MIGQAFSGWMNMNGNAGEEPVVAKPWLNDYVSAMCAVFGVLAAYTAAQKTGKGQVVDVAQSEAMASYMSDVYATYTMTGAVRGRAGNKAAAFQPYGLFKSKDGYDVALGAFGPGVYKRFIQGAGFDEEYFNYKDCSAGIDAVASPKGRELDAKVIQWCAEHTAQEIEDAMAATKVPCSRVNNAKDCLEEASIFRSAATGSSAVTRAPTPTSPPSVSPRSSPAPRVRSGAALRRLARTPKPS
jgi:crotonobetainyl-CoA:carnitine CoA-transferase CaiB-like acyl-CoA transferase